MASLDAQARERGRPEGQKAQLVQFSQLSQLTQLSGFAQSLERATSAPGLSRFQPRPFSAAVGLSRAQLAGSLRAGDGLHADRVRRPASSAARRALPRTAVAPSQQADVSRCSSQTALLPYCPLLLQRSPQRRSLTASCYVDSGCGITASRSSIASRGSAVSQQCEGSEGGVGGVGGVGGEGEAWTVSRARGDEQHEIDEEHVAELRESVERLAFQLQRIEGVTSTMTAAHTRSLQQKIGASFGEIGQRVAELDLAFLTESQAWHVHVHVHNMCMACACA